LIETINEKVKLSVVKARIEDFSQNVYNFNPEDPFEGDPLMEGIPVNRKVKNSIDCFL